MRNTSKILEWHHCGTSTATSMFLIHWENLSIASKSEYEFLYFLFFMHNYSWREEFNYYSKISSNKSQNSSSWNCWRLNWRYVFKGVWNVSIDDDGIPGHMSVLQPALLDSSSASGQLFPPKAGAGFVQVLPLVLVTFSPQVAEQAPQSLHIVHPPWTTN